MIFVDITTILLSIKPMRDGIYRNNFNIQLNF